MRSRWFLNFYSKIFCITDLSLCFCIIISMLPYYFIKIKNSYLALFIFIINSTIYWLWRRQDKSPSTSYKSHEKMSQTWVYAQPSDKASSSEWLNQDLLGGTIIRNGTIQWNFFTEVGIVAILLMGSLGFLFFSRGKGSRKAPFAPPTITFNEPKGFR